MTSYFLQSEGALSPKPPTHANMKEAEKPYKTHSETAYDLWVCAHACVYIEHMLSPQLKLKTNTPKK